MNIKITVWTSRFDVFYLFIANPIDGKTLISLYLHICIIFHHNLQRYVLLKWEYKREPQNLSIGNVVKLKQERRLKRLITLGGLEIGIQHQIVNALELSIPTPQKKQKKKKMKNS